MGIILRSDQQELVNKINKSTEKRNCIQSPTGSGKTVIFSYVANNFDGKVLILVNKKELLDQTIKWLYGDTNTIEAGKKQKHKEAMVTIAMVETFNNLIKKNDVNINDYDLIIADEVHNLQFTKVFEGYKNRLLGFTATPTTDKKERWYTCGICEKKHDNHILCCGNKTLKTVKNISLNQWYGKLITGTPISELIDMGKLVDVRDFVCDTPNLGKLKTDSTGQFTAKSEDSVFGQFVSIENLIDNYKKECLGLKTMIFNSNISVNEKAYNAFLELGYNVKSYDSKTKEDRIKIVEWFKKTPKSILMSVGCFTTGFDVDNVEAIIMNRATNSLSLYHQIVGRGGRTCEEEDKIDFKLIDLGGNVDRFNHSWSDDYDWEENYYNEEIKIFENEDEVCDNCGCIFLLEYKEQECPECGHVNKPPEKTGKKKDGVNSIAEERKKEMKPPTAKNIIKRAREKNLDINQSKNLTAELILRMFKRSRTTVEAVEKNSGYLLKEIKKMIIPIYFELHNTDNGIDGNRNRTIEDFENKVIKKINKYYEDK